MSSLGLDQGAKHKTPGSFLTPKNFVDLNETRVILQTKEEREAANAHKNISLLPAPEVDVLSHRLNGWYDSLPAGADHVGVMATVTKEPEDSDSPHIQTDSTVECIFPSTPEETGVRPDSQAMVMRSLMQQCAYPFLQQPCLMPSFAGEQAALADMSLGSQFYPRMNLGRHGEEEEEQQMWYPMEHVDQSYYMFGHEAAHSAHQQQMHETALWLQQQQSNPWSGLESWYMGSANQQSMAHGHVGHPPPACSPSAFDTLQIRNVPRRFNGHDLVEALNHAGFVDAYRFVYVPVDVDSSLSRGYAFVVLSDPHRASVMIDAINMHRVLGFKSGAHFPMAEYARRQGLTKNVEYFQNTALNARHADGSPVYPHALPLLFDAVSNSDESVSVVSRPFPPPVRQVPPRFKPSAHHHSADRQTDPFSVMITDLPPDLISPGNLTSKDTLLPLFAMEFANYGQVVEVTPATSMLCAFVRFATAAQVNCLLEALTHSDPRNDPSKGEFFFWLRSNHCVKISRAHTNSFRDRDRDRVWMSSRESVQIDSMPASTQPSWIPTSNPSLVMSGEAAQQSH